MSQKFKLIKQVTIKELSVLILCLIVRQINLIHLLVMVIRY